MVIPGRNPVSVQPACTPLTPGRSKLRFGADSAIGLDTHAIMSRSHTQPEASCQYPYKLGV